MTANYNDGSTKLVTASIMIGSQDKTIAVKNSSLKGIAANWSDYATTGVNNTPELTVEGGN